MKKRGNIIAGLIALALVAVLVYNWQVLSGLFNKNKNDNTQSTSSISSANFPVRSAIIDYVVLNIGELSPDKPVLGGKWYVTRFWFATDRQFYVEYEDGHIVRKALISVSNDKSKIAYNVTAFFEPGTSDWQLKWGVDAIFEQQLSLYEYDESSKNWILKN